MRTKRHNASWSRARVIAAALLVAGTIGVGAAHAGQPNACLRSTQGAFRACRAEAQGAKQLAAGICANLGESSAVKACTQQAASDTRDATDECRAQNKARRDVCQRLGPAPYLPPIDPANFTTTIDNPYFPLVPGTMFVYENTAAGEEVHVTVTHDTKVIFGVTCVEVKDQSFVNKQLSEDTRDWYAQDLAGNVWYFGENTATLEDGLPVSLEGSWTGGVDGAQPGIIMEAHPAVGDFYRQEYLLGTAEDLAEVVSLSSSATVPFGTYTGNALETEETSPLEPDANEHKFYVAGVGNVLTIDEETGEREELTNIIVGP